MTEKIYQREKHLMAQTGDRFKVKYEIIKVTEETSTSYGIAISSYNNDDVLNEFVEIKDITQKVIEIETLVMVLYKYEVTPVTLYDVLDVYFADLDSIIAELN